jgi:hypothetical protein
VELASQDQLALLASSLERGSIRPAGRPRKEVVLRRANAKLSTRTLEPAAHGKGHYCKCGHCRVCLQNAEWDTKFNQRFGESMKDYYSGTRPTRQASWWSEL